MLKIFEDNIVCLAFKGRTTSFVTSMVNVASTVYVRKFHFENDDVEAEYIDASFH